MNVRQIQAHGARFVAFTSGKQLKTGVLEFITHLVIAVVAYIAVLIPFYFLIATRFEEKGVQFNVSDTVKTFVGMATRMLDPVEKMRILESMDQKKSSAETSTNNDDPEQLKMKTMDKKVSDSNAVVRRFAYMKLLQVLAGGGVLVAMFYYFTQRSYRADTLRMSDATAPESLGSMLKSNILLAVVILITQTLFSLGFATWVRIVNKSELVRGCVDFIQRWNKQSSPTSAPRPKASPQQHPTLSGMKSGSSSIFPQTRLRYRHKRD